MPNGRAPLTVAWRRPDIPRPPPGLLPATPTEWVHVWRRVIVQPSVKLTGFTMASFAEWADGTRIHPGNAVLANVTGLSDAAVRRALRDIRDKYGLLWRYAEGSKNGRNGGSDEYRLTIPDDIFGRVPMLSPDYEPPPDPVDNSPDHRYSVPETKKLTVFNTGTERREHRY